MKKKNIFILIGVILAIGIMGTLAWWQWRSSINAQVFGQVCAPEMVFVGGTTINGNGLLPVRTKEEGLSKDIKVNLNNTCDNDTAVLNLNLKPDVLPEGLSDPSFKWALYKVTTEEVEGTPTETLTYINDGNFNGKRQYVNDNDLISIATDLIVTENISTYRLYIWIDGTMDNPSTIGGNSFRFKLYGTGTGAIYNQYTIANYAYSSQADLPSYFMVEDLSRDSIESIEISNISNIPSGVTSYDISSNEDGTVKLWYIENPETNLNKVYIGSDNGIVKANTSLNRTFADLTNVKKIDLTNFDTSSVTTMNYMFYNCSSLSSLDLTNFDTSKVTTMANMFQNAGTSELIINIDNFNTSQVTTMADMFNGCNASSITLSNFSNEKLTTITTMFKNCKAYTITFNSFNTSNVTSMGGNGGNEGKGVFSGCSNITSLDLSSWNTSKVTDIGELFQGCSSLKTIDLSNFNMIKVTSIRRTFRGCSKLEEINFNGTNVNKITDMFAAFENCGALRKLSLVGFDFTNAGVSYAVGGVPRSVEVIVSDCNQYNLFRTKFGTNFTNLHTVSNETCTT